MYKLKINMSNTSNMNNMSNKSKLTVVIPSDPVLQPTRLIDDAKIKIDAFIKNANVTDTTDFCHMNIRTDGSIFEKPRSL